MRDCRCGTSRSSTRRWPARGLRPTPTFCSGRTRGNAKRGSRVPFAKSWRPLEVASSTRPTPEPTDRVLASVGDLPGVLDRLSRGAVQGTVARSGEVLLLALDEIHREDR